LNKPSKPRIAIHKFTSCDGCQLAFLNMGEEFLQLAEQVDIIHFAEAGKVDSEAEVDIAFVEGSVSTPSEIERIHRIRQNSKYLITIGACATSGGIQALRNGVGSSADWVSAIYASPEYIQTLQSSRAISKQVNVDFELWGCPVNSRQVIQAIRDRLSGVRPSITADSVCLECKRKGNVCVLVAQGKPCMGPVTRTGCGALCPSFGRDCYGCYGPSEQVNATALARRFEGLGLMPEQVARRFLFIHSAADAFSDAGKK